MKRFLLALNIQDHFNPAPSMVDQITKLAEQMPAAATVFIGDENKVSFSARGLRAGPENDTCRLPIDSVFHQYGYGLPPELTQWFQDKGAEEVIVAGGLRDERVLAAGISLFDAGIRPVLIPILCYGNNWYEHTVTINLWEQRLGPVYQSPVEAGLAA